MEKWMLSLDIISDVLIQDFGNIVNRLIQSYIGQYK